MKNKRLLTLSAIVCMALVIAGLPFMGACAKPAAPAKVIELKWNVSELQTDSRWTKVWEPLWKAEIEKRTKGAVKITPYFSSGLAPEKEAYDAVRKGICDMTNQTGATMPRPCPMTDVRAQALPSQVCQRPTRVLYELYKGIPEIQAEYADTHLFMLYSPFPYFVVETREKPVRTMEDMKGQKLWALGSETGAKTKALGGTPVSIPTGDVSMALQTKVLDGVVSNPITLISYKWNESLKYLTDVNLNYGSSWLTMNKEKWNSLPPDIQKVFNEVSEETMGEWDKYAVAEAKLAIDTSIKERGLQVIKLTPEEAARWDKACQSVRDAWLARVTTSGLPGKKALDLYDELLKKYAKL